MKLITKKNLATVSAVALSVASGASDALAQSENLTATLKTNSAITSNVANNLDFGTWFISFAANSTPILTMNTNGAVTVTQTGVLGNSQVVQIVAPTNRGQINVQSPANNVTLKMTCSNKVDFTNGTNLSLSKVNYQTVSNPNAECSFVANTTQPVKVITGGVDELVSFGGNISITGTPPDDMAPGHQASFQVDFAY